MPAEPTGCFSTSSTSARANCAAYARKNSEMYTWTLAGAAKGARMSTLWHMSTEHNSPAVFITAPNNPTDRMPGSTAKIYIYAPELCTCARPCQQSMPN